MRMNPFNACARNRQAVALAVSLTVLAAGLAACGKSPAAPAPSGKGAATSNAAIAAETAQPAAAADADATGLAARTGELSNPDNPTMVFLYYDLAGIAPPIGQWVEQDNRVRFARGADKATQRKTVTAEFEAGMAAVRGVGVLHLTVNAGLSEYDPGYAEFTIGAFAPSAVYEFRTLGQEVALKFDNGLAAQSWSVPKARAQAIVDRIGNDPLSLDTTLKIHQVLPGPGGGTLVAHIVSWNLRDTRDGTTIARAQVPSG